MDDPLAALDGRVKKLILDQVFLGCLASKTRILITHSVDFLPVADRVILVNDGQIILDGSYKDVKNDDYIKALIEISKDQQREQEEMI